MALFTACIGTALALLILRFLVVRARNVRDSRRARQMGCKPLRTPDRNDPFGWKAFKVLRKASTRHMLPIQIGLDMDRVGKNPHTVQRHFLWQKIIMTRDPENIKTILSTQASDWELGEIRRGILSSYTGAGVLTSEGQAWKNSRSYVRPQFSQASVADLSLFESHARDLLRRLVPNADGWTLTTDILPLFYNLTLDVSTEFFYGQSVHSQNLGAQATLGDSGRASPPNGEVFTEAIDIAADWVSRMSTLGKWYKIAPARKFKRARAQIYEMVDWYVQKAVERAGEKPSMGPSGASRFVVLDELAKLSDDKLWLRHETVGLMAGGRTTSAALLGWLFFYLAREPSIFHKLRLSILEDFGTESQVRQITAAQLRACHYLRCCIHEALRLGSPTPTTVRAATRNTTLPQGGGPEGQDPIYIPKGTVVTMSLFNLHHRKDLWGNDVEEFKPERWTSFNRGWDFIPFGGGPRICIGRELALNEIHYVVVYLLQRCDDIQLMHTTRRVSHDAAISNKPGDGVHVRVHHIQRT